MPCEHVAFCRECLTRYLATAYAHVCPLYDCLQRDATFELWEGAGNEVTPWTGVDWDERDDEK
jgi:hypothetical protein